MRHLSKILFIIGIFALTNCEDETIKSILKDLKKLSFNELKSTAFTISGKEIKTTPLSNDKLKILEKEITIDFEISTKATFYFNGRKVEKGAKIKLNRDAKPRVFTANIKIVAEDGSSKSYTLTIEVKASDKKEITAFAISELTGTTFNITSDEIKTASPISADKKATLQGKITLKFTASPNANVYIGSTKISDGHQVKLDQNRANPKIYNVTLKVVAEDGSYKNYIVAVELGKSSKTALKSFTFKAAHNTEITVDIKGKISSGTVTFDNPIPKGVNMRKLIASFEISEGATVKVANTAQVNNVTVNNFMGKVTYTVLAENGVNQAQYTVNTEQVIDEPYTVTNNGADMKMYVYGNTKAKAVVLLVHGGPGGNAHGWHFLQEFAKVMEKKYVMAYWDQRATGMSIDGGGDDPSQLTVANHIADMEAVVTNLKKNYPDFKIFTLGSSWGGMLIPAFLAKGDNQKDIAGWIQAEGNHNTPLSRQLGVKMLVREADVEIAAGRDSDSDGDGENDWQAIKNIAQNIDLDDYRIDLLFKLYGTTGVAEELKLKNLEKAGLLPPKDSEKPHTPLHVTGKKGERFEGNDKVIIAMAPEVVKYSTSPVLHKIKTPVRILYGKWDFLCPPGMADDLYDKVGSTDKQKIEFTLSGHGVLDYEYKKGLKIITEFFDSKL